jgi:hypothetical protein
MRALFDLLALNSSNNGAGRIFAPGTHPESATESFFRDGRLFWKKCREGFQGLIKLLSFVRIENRVGGGFLNVNQYPAEDTRNLNASGKWADSNIGWGQHI